MSPTIEVSDLGKRYVIEHESRHDNLRDTLHHTVRKLWRRYRWGTGFTREEFWALRDVSFAVAPGEVVGIIGRNGAGKSTLLKILSRITEPTTGRAVIRGRVASLLEVGTGFHPELTGRENIYLNGAVLGMSRAEIRRKFDEIVAFAEIEQFLDTPVKRYSSGMYVRLAFAVAAHLEPEILIVDEVLAVGDVAFQKKCLGKMEDVAAGQGRTVLLVSHNLATIKSLTRQCIYLRQGGIRAIGPTAVALDHYARDLRSSDPSSRGTGAHSRILHAAMVDATGREITVHDGRAVTELDVELETDGVPDLILECYLNDGEGTKIGIFSPGHFSGWRLPDRPGRWKVRLTLRIPPLASGTYLFDLATTIVGRGYDHFWPDAVVSDVHALTMRPARWEVKKEFRAGFIVMDGEKLPEVREIS